LSTAGVVGEDNGRQIRGRKKIRRKEKILFLLNQANEIYPLNTEKWMRGFWEET